MTAPHFPADVDECTTYVLAEALIRRALNHQDPHSRFAAWWRQAQRAPDVQ